MSKAVINIGRQIAKKPGEVGGGVVIRVEICPASQSQVPAESIMFCSEYFFIGSIVLN